MSVASRKKTVGRKTTKGAGKASADKQGNSVARRTASTQSPSEPPAANVPAGGRAKANASPGPAKLGAAPRRKIAEALSPKAPRAIEREMLVVELHRLRALFVEISHRFVADGEAKLVALADRAERSDLSPSAAKKLLAAVRDLRVKPHKGRGKDLARIEALAASLDESLPD